MDFRIRAGFDFSFSVEFFGTNLTRWQPQSPRHRHLQFGEGKRDDNDDNGDGDDDDNDDANDDNDDDNGDDDDNDDANDDNDENNDVTNGEWKWKATTGSRLRIPPQLQGYLP